MATMAYPGYDHFSRQTPHLSRRQSISYGLGGQQIPFPIEAQQSVYDDPPLAGYGGYPPRTPHSGYASASQLALAPYNPGPEYDEPIVQDPYYDERPYSNSTGYPTTPYGSGLHRRRRSMSFGPEYGSEGYSRPRRRSTSSYGRRSSSDSYHSSAGSAIKFKCKGAYNSGISLNEAQSNVRLSNRDRYTLHQMNADSSGRIHVKVRWNGYRSLEYEIPLEWYDGRLDLQTLARRVSRAIVHFIRTYRIPVSWDRVQIHQLDEINYGTWQPLIAVV